MEKCDKCQTISFLTNYNGMNLCSSCIAVMQSQEEQKAKLRQDLKSHVQ